MSVGTPRGSAQLTSTPSCSRRKSQCRRRAWCSWITKVGAPSAEGAGAASGTGSGVFLWSRMDRYFASRSGPSARSNVAIRSGVGSSDARCPAVSSASGSPRRATRLSTSRKSSCARSLLASSRHVRGAATIGCDRPRSEYGAIVVLLPLFWLQSTSTLPSRSVFLMSLTTRSGWSASSARASSWATAETSSLVCLPSSAAYRWMPLLPLVTGIGLSPIPSRMTFAQRAISAHSASPVPGPGSRSSTIRSGFFRMPVRPNCHCGTCSSSAACWAIQVSVARSFTSGYTFGPDLCSIVRRWIQSGAESGRFFSKKTCPGSSSVPTPFTQRLRVTGRFETWGSSTGAIRA